MLGGRSVQVCWGEGGGDDPVESVSTRYEVQEAG